MASANELEVHLKMAADLGYIAQETVERLSQEYGIVGKQLNRLIAARRHFERPAASIQLPE